MATKDKNTKDSSTVAIDYTTKESILTDKKVKVVPVYRNGGWLPQGHDGEFMFTGTVCEFDLPISMKTGRLVNILTKEEQAFFEKELFLNPGDLSIYKKKDNYWHTFKVKLDKEERIFDLSDPIDNLCYRVCVVSPHVAPNWESRYQSASFQFALQDEEVIVQEKVTKANKKKDAYKFLGRVENNPDRMRNVLRVYGNKVAPNTPANVMYTTIEELIDDDKSLPKLLAVINDPNFEMRIFIEDALSVGAILKDGTRYTLPGGDKIGGVLNDVIDFFKDAVNQDIYLKIKNQIDLSTSK
jgi:hypothetical protein